MTVCTKNKDHFFVAEPLRFHDTSQGQKFDLSPAGEIVSKVWNELPNRWPGIIQDSLVIMPNHIHVIIGFNGPIIQNGSVKTDIRCNRPMEIVILASYETTMEL